ncbi:hypothetical protein YC2023_047175 [Brassica napus]
MLFLTGLDLVEGSQISGLLKYLNMIASLTAETNSELRKAALNTMATGYKFLGELLKS